MKHNFYGRFYTFVRSLVRTCISPKYSVQVPDELMDSPAVYISHHQNLFGPLAAQLWFPKSLHVWILHVFLDREACYKQYAEYTFSQRFRMNKTLAKWCAWLLSYAIPKFLNSGKGIPVYRGSRKIMETFRITVEALMKGDSIVIFPDRDYSDESSGVKEMYDGFLYIEKYYHKAAGKHVQFVPLYVSKKQTMLITGEPVCFRDGEDFNHERKRVHQNIHDSLNRLAVLCGDLQADSSPARMMDAERSAISKD